MYAIFGSDYRFCTVLITEIAQTANLVGNLTGGWSLLRPSPLPTQEQQRVRVSWDANGGAHILTPQPHQPRNQTNYKPLGAKKLLEPLI